MRFLSKMEFELLPNEIYQKIWSHLSLKDRVNCELVSKRWLHLLRNASPRAFQMEKNAYFAYVVTSGLQQGGSPVNVRIRAAAAIQRPWFPWSQPEEGQVRVIILQVRTGAIEGRSA